jgi:hypothetical protein
MRVFLSVASSDRAQAEEVSLALRGEGHIVFLDDQELPPGESYHLRIRKAIELADIIVFFVSPASIHPKRYTLAELKFAQDKWPTPDGRVLPVLVAPTDMRAIPAYLRAVSIYTVRGNIAAEVAYEVNRMVRALPRRGRTSKEDPGKGAQGGRGLTGLATKDLVTALLFFVPLGLAVGLLNATISLFFQGSNAVTEAVFCGIAFAALVCFALYYFNFRSLRELLIGAAASLLAHVIAAFLYEQFGHMTVAEWAFIGAARSAVLAFAMLLAVPPFAGRGMLGALVLAGALSSGIAEALPDAFGFTKNIEPVLWDTLVAATLSAVLAVGASIDIGDDAEAVVRRKGGSR